MNDVEKRKILSEVALGNIPPDTVIVNGTLFNVFTGEFITKQSIWIKDGRIAYVDLIMASQKESKQTVIDADGMVLLPGLIEGHTHLNRSGIEEYTRHVIPERCHHGCNGDDGLRSDCWKKGNRIFRQGVSKGSRSDSTTLFLLCVASLL